MTLNIQIFGIFLTDVEAYVAKMDKYFLLRKEITVDYYLIAGAPRPFKRDLGRSNPVVYVPGHDLYIAQHDIYPTYSGDEIRTLPLCKGQNPESEFLDTDLVSEPAVFFNSRHLYGSELRFYELYRSTQRILSCNDAEAANTDYLRSITFDNIPKHFFVTLKLRNGFNERLHCNLDNFKDFLVTGFSSENIFPPKD